MFLPTIKRKMTLHKLYKINKIIINDKKLPPTEHWKSMEIPQPRSV